MILIAHIVKYAQETLADYGELSWSHATRLEIQTLGRGGVRFRSNLGELHRVWHHAQAVPVNELVDACGAGDWFTALLVDRLCRAGARGLRSVSKTILFDAVDLAQRIAAWNCAYAGARGGMYSSEGRRELRSLARIDRRLVAAQYEVESDDAAAQICGCTISTAKTESAIRVPSRLPS
jgi:fructokinase